jgi:hypothetical protein
MPSAIGKSTLAPIFLNTGQCEIDFRGARAAKYGRYFNRQWSRDLGLSFTAASGKPTMITGSPAP